MPLTQEWLYRPAASAYTLHKLDLWLIGRARSETLPEISRIGRHNSLSGRITRQTTYLLFFFYGSTTFFIVFWPSQPNMTHLVASNCSGQEDGLGDWLARSAPE
jgi:hypothetical protein